MSATVKLVTEIVMAIESAVASARHLADAGADAEFVRGYLSGVETVGLIFGIKVEQDGAVRELTIYDR